ncbi:hypothetical protein [Actinoplanes sp. HUAS TT8]|uniref:hypothetical protein n=1 Tax=Actinoplanes sp. HUAS TT8 TaxID=3447453 RepID=UPI003F51CA82
MTATHRALLIAAAGTTTMAMLTGCATTMTSASTTAAAPAATTSAAPIVATIPSPAPPTSKTPTLTNTGTNWPKIVGSLLTYGQWLLANPNPGLTSTITEPGCAADNALTAELQTYVDQNAYVQPAAPTLTSIVGPTGSPAALGGQVTVDIQAVRGTEHIIDRTTKNSTTHILSTRPGLPPTSYQLTLIHDANNSWRLCTVTDVDTPDTDAITSLL